MTSWHQIRGTFYKRNILSIYLIKVFLFDMKNTYFIGFYA